MGALVWVEGIIGAGKSTLTAALADKLQLRGIYEPVETNPMLDKFYADPKKYAFPMQMYLMAKRHAMQQLAAWEATAGATIAGTEFKGAVVDRGLPGDRVFCKLHVQEGNIDPEMWEVYETFYDVMSLNLPTPSLLVFLDVEPEVAHERMTKRGRSAEAGVPVEYLRKLRRGYLDLLVEIESGTHAWSRGMRVVRVPWNADNQDTQPIVDAVRHHCRL